MALPWLSRCRRLLSEEEAWLPAAAAAEEEGKEWWGLLLWLLLWSWWSGPSVPVAVAGWWEWVLGEGCWRWWCCCWMGVYLVGVEISMAFIYVDGGGGKTQIHPSIHPGYLD